MPVRDAKPVRGDARRSRRREEEPADMGWNGPIPEFLGVSALA